jgi:hypothetical protein
MLTPDATQLKLETAAATLPPVCHCPAQTRAQSVAELVESWLWENRWAFND